jgi:hypothetical protein
MLDELARHVHRCGSRVGVGCQLAKDARPGDGSEARPPSDYFGREHHTRRTNVTRSPLNRIGSSQRGACPTSA